MILDKKMQVFLAIAEAGSFSRAARQLSLSQSVVSFHLDALEKELGVSLFRRQGRTITLTPEGEFLFQEGKKLEQEAMHLENALSEHSTTIARRIYLAGDALTCAFTLPWTLAAFQKTYPEVQFTYQHLDPETLLGKLLSGNLDMALVGYPLQHRKLTAQECYHDEIVLVAAPDKAPDRVTLDELRHQPLLWITNDRGLELTLTQALSEAGLPPKDLKILMEVEDLPIVKTFIRAGMGFAFLPTLTVADELHFNLLKTVTVEGLAVKRTTYLVYARKKQQREVVTRFLDFVQKRRWTEMSAEQKESAVIPRPSKETPD